MADTRIKFGKADRSEELFSEIAQENAKRIAEDGKDRWGNQKNNKSSQLRKFYDELVMWHDKVYRHRDYFDAGALLYEHVPLLGRVIRWLKRRMG